MSTPTGQSWEAKFDGKEYPVKGIYANETVSVKKLGDCVIELTYKRDGKIYSIAKITVSPDGKKMPPSPTTSKPEESRRLSTKSNSES